MSAGRRVDAAGHSLDTVGPLVSGLWTRWTEWTESFLLFLVMVLPAGYRAIARQVLGQAPSACPPRPPCPRRPACLPVRVGSPAYGLSPTGSSPCV